MKHFLLLLIALVGSAVFQVNDSHAYNWRKCRGFVVDQGFRWRDYDYAGPGMNFMLTEGTNKVGSPAATAFSSTESTTASLDPGVTTRSNTSLTQYISSKDECSAYGLNQKLQERDEFLAHNLHEVKRDMARGEGEYLSSLSFLSACDETVTARFGSALKANFEKLATVNTNEDYLADHIDEIILSDNVLKKSCLN